MNNEKRIQDKNIWVVYIATLVLGMGYGISIGLTSIFLDSKGYSNAQIGYMASWFAIGIIALSMPMANIIRALSAKATLIASLLGYATVAGLFPLMPSYPATALIRGLDGAFSVGIWVSCETILLIRSDIRFKGFVMSIYAVTLASGYISGPLLAKVIIAYFPIWTAFFFASGFAVAAALIVIVFLDRISTRPPENHPAENPRDQAPSPIKSLFLQIKISCLGTFSYGYFQASLVIFLPLYLMKMKGISKDNTIIVPAFFAVGMLLFSNIAGRLGDTYGHLRTMRTLAAIGMCMVLGFVWLDSFVIMSIAVFIAGCTLASISPVSLALQGLIVSHADYSRANGLYNASYAAGMLIGPTISGRLFENYGQKGGAYMLYHLAAIWLFFVLFTIIFRKDDPTVKGRAFRT